MINFICVLYFSFIRWLLAVVVFPFLSLPICLSVKYALRVPPAVTRLTVYRRLRVFEGNSALHVALEKIELGGAGLSPIKPN